MFQLFRMLSFEEDPICCCFFVNHVFVFGTIWDFLRRCGKVVKKQTNMTLKITSFSASLSQFVGGLKRFKRMFKHNFVATRAGKNIHVA